jgi:PKD repeat protein
MKIEWDFGDGQTAQGISVDHVFMTDGVYPVRLAYRFGSSNSGGDAQTNRIMVARDYSHPDAPQTNDPPVQSKIVATYDVSQMPLNWLPWATVLHFKAGNTNAMLATAARLASEPHHGDSNLAYTTLTEVTQENGASPDEIANIWSKVPRQSDLQPRAVKLLSNVQLWETADFAAAKVTLEPFISGSDPGIARRYAQALLLLGNANEAKKIFDKQTEPDTTGRAAAMSGAMARTVEFFITEGNVDAGEEAWERWQSRFPADFLEGYSVLLRVKLINIAGHPIAAAKVAEAFAMAMPHSSYSPSLLDKASKFIAKLDPARSAALRATLKERYPEDPLSQ